MNEAIKKLQERVNQLNREMRDNEKEYARIEQEQADRRFAFKEKKAQKTALEIAIVVLQEKNSVITCGTMGEEVVLNNKQLNEFLAARNIPPNNESFTHNERVNMLTDNDERN